MVSPQILCELFAVITDKRRVEHPTSSQEAAEICLDLLECLEIEKVNPTLAAAREAFGLADELELTGADIFDCFMAATAKENGIEAIYTENTRDFEIYSFLSVLNPLGSDPLT